MNYEVKESRQRYLAFNAGMLTAILFFHTLPEVFNGEVGAATAVAFLILGVSAQYLLHRLYHASSIGNQFLVFLHLHNITDGLAIGFAWKISTSFGLAVTAGIVAHDILHKIIGYSFLVHHGNSKKTALIKIALTFLSVLAGAVIVLSFSIAEDWAHKGGAFAAGSLAFVTYLLVQEVFWKHKH